MVGHVAASDAWPPEELWERNVLRAGFHRTFLAHHRRASEPALSKRGVCVMIACGDGAK
jgi:hypothetical protein